MAGADRRRSRRDEGDRDDRRAQPPAASPAPLAAAADLARTVGNQGFAQLAREGAGLLPSGRVHDDVRAAIDATRGGGRSLEPATRGRVGEALGDSLHDVRVHTDTTAAALARSVEARAFTTGSDIYFGAGEYRPGHPEGERLLAHELTHVVQQRGAPTSGPMTVTQPGDAQEAEAETVADDLAD